MKLTNKEIKKFLKKVKKETKLIVCGIEKIKRIKTLNTNNIFPYSINEYKFYVCHNADEIIVNLTFFDDRRLFIVYDTSKKYIDKTDLDIMITLLDTFIEIAKKFNIDVKVQ